MPVENPNKLPYASAPINGVTLSRRPVPIEAQIVTVYDKEGLPHHVQRHVASDYVRIRGWTRTIPAPISEEEAVDALIDPSTITSVRDAAILDVLDQGSDHNADVVEAAIASLEALRTEAIGLGAEIDMRWGRKRLGEVIAATKSANEAAAVKAEKAVKAAKAD